ncbi:GNAT family N-acetyltransferase [Fodinicola feengrottensis]|uniref:GNAT family N-acetyltransferase n=1 Tax=Fodinicola feengrottensis TaxID=435914 RepID=UPI0031E1075A
MNGASTSSELAEWSVAPEPVAGPDATDLLRLYFTELIVRYSRRTATEAEIDEALADEPSADLVPPTGLFLVARYRNQPVGCVGLKVLTPQITELKRVFIREPYRGLGGGSRVLDAIEQAARALGATAMRLDVRADLVEARRLYARNGYVEIAPYSDARYADHWLEKQLRHPTSQADH